MIWFLLTIISFTLALYTLKKLDDYVPLWFVLLAGFLSLIPLVNVLVILAALAILVYDWVNSEKIQALLDKKIL